ncbi:MAG: hypothetical protein RLZZ387_3333 [Chloroflexota bacterium]|jgi:hypothetical protein
MLNDINSSKRLTMMNSTMMTGGALTVLGLGGVLATGAATAVIPAVFGLILLGLGALLRRPGRAQVVSWVALGVALLGLLAPLGNLGRVLSAGPFVLNAASFANIAMALICGLYLASWGWERRSAGRSDAAR